MAPLVGVPRAPRRCPGGDGGTGAVAAREVFALLAGRHTGGALEQPAKEGGILLADGGADDFTERAPPLSISLAMATRLACR